MPNEPVTKEIHIYTDGGARGNPGAAACAFVIKARTPAEIIHEGSLLLGTSTNNQAEYLGLITALSWLVEHLDLLSGINVLIFFSDSELMVNQLSGFYKVKDLKISALYSQIQQYLSQIKEHYPVRVTFTHIPRSKNTRADQLVNMALDAS